MSQFHFLTDEEVTESISDDTKTLRACLLDTRSTYLVFTVPSASPYRAQENLSPLLENLSRIGISPKLYKASDSEDIQIYVSFSEPVKTEEMGRQLSAFLGNCGIATGNDTLIIHSTGHPFALPLQPGFTWLNDSLEPKLRREEVSLPAAVAVFLRDLDNAAICPTTLEAKLAVQSLTPVETAILILPSTAEIDNATNSPTAEVEIEPLSEPQKWDERAPESSVPAAIETVDFPATEVAFTDNTVGMQLLLFPTTKQPEVSALPKGRPRRGKRARSNLPDSADAGASAHDQVFPIDLPGDFCPSLFN